METTEQHATGKQKQRHRRMARPKSPPAIVDAPVVASPSAEKQTSLAVLTGMLARPEGATLAAMQEASGWQAHSVRGFLAGTLKKKGYTVTSEPAEGGRIYRATCSDSAADA